MILYSASTDGTARAWQLTEDEQAGESDAVDEPIDYSDWAMPELQAECKRRTLPVKVR